MSAPFDLHNAGLRHAAIEVPPSDGILSRLTDQQHEKLLKYLVDRLTYGNINRGIRLNRYARIDKMISTWQKLNKSDSEREVVEDLTGKSQALPVNLPLLATHLEDSVAFFAEVFSPTGRDFYSTPAKNDSEAAKQLAMKMNRDTKARKYYKEICATFRSLLKYNMGGFAVRWEAGGGLAEMAQPGNRTESIDMYNFLWDPLIKDVSRIAQEAEWSARISLKSHMWLVRRALKGELERVHHVLRSHQEKLNEAAAQQVNRRLAKKATFYKFPPTHVGLSEDGADERTSRSDETGVDWRSYGASLDTDSKPEIDGFEVVEKYCWLNPKEFGLVEDKAVEDDYSLWRFILIDSCQVCFAEAVETVEGQTPEIPHYLSYLTQDDMKEAQRSMMEMMKGFQRLTSFLVNIFIAAARKNIWGIKAVDPSMFDTSDIEQGDVAAVLKSKIQGRDVRSGLMSLDTESGSKEPFAMLAQVLELVKVFYPNQAQPSQIAGIDRAVKSQVAAVLQSGNRRLHMLCKLVDADLMNPTRVQCYRNLAVYDNEGLNGLDEELVSKVLGSGLDQLNSEKLSEQLKELIFALFQNPEAMQTFDVSSLLNYWSRIMNSPDDLGSFVRQQQTAIPSAEAASPVA